MVRRSFADPQRTTPNPRLPAPTGSTGRDAPDQMGPRSSASRTRLARWADNTGRVRRVGPRARSTSTRPSRNRAWEIHDSVDPIRSTLIFGSSFIGLGMLAWLLRSFSTPEFCRLEAPDYAYNAMRPTDCDGCDHAAYDRRIRPRRNSSMTDIATDFPGNPDVDRPSSRHADMVWIPGGTFRMGSDKHYAEEAPVHQRDSRRLLD